MDELDKSRDGVGTHRAGFV
jgi:hypothetical protein